MFFLRLNVYMFEHNLHVAMNALCTRINNLFIFFGIAFTLASYFMSHSCVFFIYCSMCSSRNGVGAHRAGSAGYGSTACSGSGSGSSAGPGPEQHLPTTCHPHNRCIFQSGSSTGERLQKVHITVSTFDDLYDNNEHKNSDKGFPLNLCMFYKICDNATNWFRSALFICNSNNCAKQAGFG